MGFGSMVAVSTLQYTDRLSSQNIFPEGGIGCEQERSIEASLDGASSDVFQLTQGMCIGGWVDPEKI